MNDNPRPRLRDLGLASGLYPPGPLNAITDLPGLLVGHFTLIQGDDVRTGATAILPHPGNLFQDKVPAGLAVGNGFGKLMGATQVQELGEIETPILLTNTLAIPRAAEAILDWTLGHPGNESVVSVNPVVGETNDARLNDIRKRALTSEMMLRALREAKSGPVEEGSVGAGTGTVAFGWKGGIGTSSRLLPPADGGYILGALVQSNFGGQLHILGRPVPPPAERPRADRSGSSSGAGSILIVLATDAPLSAHSLSRLARRGLAGLARTGASFANGSGDYALAFSTSMEVRRTTERRKQAAFLLDLPNDRLSPLFQAAIETTEEAIYNSLLRATPLTGYRGVTIEALPLFYLFPLPPLLG
jgi:D-aminopeptidase